MGKVLSKRISFYSFNAKIKVDYEGQEESQKVTAYLSMLRDSMILVQLKGALGIVGLQIKITKDSVILVNKVDKWVQKRSIAYLKEVADIPFDFYTLQDVIIGNPVFTDSNIVSYKNSGNHLQVLMVGGLFKHFITLENNDYKVLHSKLDDVDMLRNRTCDITYGEYTTVNNILFSTYRKISVAEKSKLDISLDFKELSFNEPLKYGFTIPKNYKRK